MLRKWMNHIYVSFDPQFTLLKLENLHVLALDRPYPQAIDSELSDLDAAAASAAACFGDFPDYAAKLRRFDRIIFGVRNCLVLVFCETVFFKWNLFLMDVFFWIVFIGGFWLRFLDWSFWIDWSVRWLPRRAGSVLVLRGAAHLGSETLRGRNDRRGNWDLKSLKAPRSWMKMSQKSVCSKMDEHVKVCNLLNVHLFSQPGLVPQNGVKSSPSGYLMGCFEETPGKSKLPEGAIDPGAAVEKAWGEQQAKVPLFGDKGSIVGPFVLYKLEMAHEKLTCPKRSKKAEFSSCDRVARVNLMIPPMAPKQTVGVALFLVFPHK